MISNCTCKPDLDQVQGVKHQRGHHSATQSCHQVLYPHMAEDVLDMSQKRHGFAGQPRPCHVNVVRRGAHVYLWFTEASSCQLAVFRAENKMLLHNTQAITHCHCCRIQTWRTAGTRCLKPPHLGFTWDSEARFRHVGIGYCTTCHVEVSLLDLATGSDLAWS